MWLCLCLVQVLDLNSTHDKLSKCEVQFEIVNAGFVVEGSLSAIVVEGYFDPEKITASYIHIVANPATINTGISIRDKHLQRADYFNTNEYPEIKLVSQSFEKISKTKFLGKFALSIKGITRDCLITFTTKPFGEKKRYEGTFSIDRLAFGIGLTSSVLSKDVLIKFRIM